MPVNSTNHGVHAGNLPILHVCSVTSIYGKLPTSNLRQVPTPSTPQLPVINNHHTTLMTLFQNAYKGAKMATRTCARPSLPILANNINNNNTLPGFVAKLTSNPTVILYSFSQVVVCVATMSFFFFFHAGGNVYSFTCKDYTVKYSVLYYGCSFLHGDSKSWLLSWYVQVVRYSETETETETETEI